MNANYVLNVSEAAEYLRLTPKTVRQYARERKLPAKKLGSQWRFLRSALEQWLCQEYSVGEQKPAGVVSTSEGNAWHYSKETKCIGSMLGTKGSEYEDLLGL